LGIIIFVGKKYGIFMDPANSSRPQHYHSKLTSRAGGIGILLGISFFLFEPLGLQLMLPALFAFLSGILEDYHSNISPRTRLGLQLIAATTAIWFTNSVVTYLGLGISMPYWVGIFFSAFAIVGMMNAINIIDGFNGLASGTILLILLSFGITAYAHHNIEMLHIILIVFGATLGFFLLNFPNGKIFLGDGGAYLLGFIIAIIGIFLASKYDDVSPWYILAVFIYPVWEVLFSIFRKLQQGISPLHPDKYHLHMLVYQHITKNNPLTALFLVLFILPFITISTLFPNKSNLNILVALCFILCYLLFYRYLIRKKG
jgi:UDP-N-acetylmuramyl pentapeptide phosphotransferase/UDP-N-acetylglucosamine-1-phosphate transferase